MRGIILEKQVQITQILRHVLRLSVFFCLCGASGLSGAAAEEDPDYLAMPEDDGKDFAYLVCSDCHAMQQVLQKPYNRKGWQDAIKRMTDDFGMADLEPDERTLIVDYLTRHYGTGSGR